MNYLDFKSWKSTRSKEMTELSGARSDDIFIFTRYTEYKPLVKSNQILFSEKDKYINFKKLCNEFNF